MFARRVSMQLKPNLAADFTHKLEEKVLPLLRKQNGFQDEMTFIAPDGTNVFGISLWDRKENAETYGRTTYPEVVNILSAMVEGTPKVSTFDVSNSTFHKIAAAVTA
jgi:hypothetical protein